MKHIEDSSQPFSPSKPNDPALLDRVRLDDLREIGLLDRALDLFLETSPREMQRLSDAIAEGRLRDAYLISHSLKGSSATLGAVQVAALCAALCAALSDEREARSAGVLVEALALSMLQTNALLAAQR